MVSVYPSSYRAFVDFESVEFIVKPVSHRDPLLPPGCCPISRPLVRPRALFFDHVGSVAVTDDSGGVADACRRAVRVVCLACRPSKGSQDWTVAGISHRYSSVMPRWPPPHPPNQPRNCQQENGIQRMTAGFTPHEAPRLGGIGKNESKSGCSQLLGVLGFCPRDSHQDFAYSNQTVFSPSRHHSALCPRAEQLKSLHSCPVVHGTAQL